VKTEGNITLRIPRDRWKNIKINMNVVRRDDVD
jgi:hypothetical protein